MINNVLLVHTVSLLRLLAAVQRTARSMCRPFALDRNFRRIVSAASRRRVVRSDARERPDRGIGALAGAPDAVFTGRDEREDAGDLGLGRLDDI